MHRNIDMQMRDSVPNYLIMHNHGDMRISFTETLLQTTYIKKCTQAIQTASMCLIVIIGKIKNATFHDKK